MSAEPQPPPPPPPPAMNPPIEPVTIRSIIIRNKEIIGELLRLALANNMTIVPLSATGRISHAELEQIRSRVTVRVNNGLYQIEAICGSIYPPQLEWRHSCVLVRLSGNVGGSCLCRRLVSHGDVEVKFEMRRELQEQVPVRRELPAVRERSMITITTNQDICGSLASFSQRTGQIICLKNATGAILDGTVFSLTRRQLLTNLGRAHILQLTGEVFPNGTGYIDITLSGVFGGTARAYSLITDGDVVLDVTLFRNHYLNRTEANLYSRAVAARRDG